MIGNHFSLKVSTVAAASFVAFVMFCSAANLVLSVQSYGYFSIVRLVSFAILLLLCFFIYIERERYFSFKGVLVFVFLFFVAVFLHYIFNDTLFDFVVARDFLILVVGVFSSIGLLSMYSLEVDKKICHYLLFVFLFVVFSLFITGSLIIGLPPSFDFGYGSLLIGREETYSLGVSNFFGMLSIVLLYSSLSKYGAPSLMLVLSLLSLFFSMLGGARGEFIIALLMYSIIFVFYRFSFVRFALFVFFIVFSIVFVLSQFDLQELIAGYEFFKRFESLQAGDLSSRDTLVRDTINLLYQKPYCLIIGCGSGYFQQFYSYPFELYPHNSVLEFIVSFGFVLFFIVFAFSMLGLVRFFKLYGVFSAPVIVFLYNFLVSLKSGYLLGAWLFFSFTFAFCIFCFTRSNVVADRV